MSADDVARPLRRSLFFVPGDSPRKLEKARQIGADTLLLDLEDAVALAQKDLAREQVAAFLRVGDFGGAEPAVRINPFDTPWFERDLEAAISSGATAIMLPKTERAEQLRELAERMTELERRSRPDGARATRILALVETAAGVVDAASLAKATPRVEALCFGHADFSRDMQLASADASEGVVFHARCSVAIAARAGGVSPIDTVHLEVRDEGAFARDAQRGRDLGFEGKLCIHPMQVEIANRIHNPTSEQIDYARRVVDAAARAEEEGLGVFTVDGKMVDAPLVSAQRRILERAARAGLLA